MMSTVHSTRVRAPEYTHPVKQSQPEQSTNMTIITQTSRGGGMLRGDAKPDNTETLAKNTSKYNMRKKNWHLECQNPIQIGSFN